MGSDRLRLWRVRVDAISVLWWAAHSGYIGGELAGRRVGSKRHVQRQFPGRSQGRGDHYSLAS